MPERPVTCRYVRVDGRAVHYRHAGRGTPVVLLHASPRSSRTLLPLLKTGPDGHAFYAIDLPGFGRSEALTLPFAPIEAFADALAATLDALGLGRVRLYGTHTGAAIAVVFAVRHPDRVGSLVLDGLSCFDDDECRGLDGYLPPFAPDGDGTHMTWAWNRMRDQALFFPWNERRTDRRLGRPVPETDALHAAVLDLLIAADYRSAYAAAFRTDAARWVARLTVDARIGCRPDDVLATHLGRLGVVPGVEVGLYPLSTAAWAAEVWRALARGSPIADAPQPADPAPVEGVVVDLHRGPTGSRTHWRVCDASRGRPLVVLHASPGSARSVAPHLARRVGVRPVYACDLPGHGESDVDGADAMVDALVVRLADLGVDEAGLLGFGSGGWLASQLAARAPQRWSVEGLPGAPVVGATAPRGLRPRHDGGHLFAAWLDARDAAILGPWWTRDARTLHDFGDALDLAAIQHEAVDRLVEAPAAARWRRAVARSAAARA